MITLEPLGNGTIDVYNNERLGYASVCPRTISMNHNCAILFYIELNESGFLTTMTSSLINHLTTEEPCLEGQLIKASTRLSYALAEKVLKPLIKRCNEQNRDTLELMKYFIRGVRRSCGDKEANFLVERVKAY
jgi:hypothetical protein